jgi:hypothetical protein
VAEGTPLSEPEFFYIGFARPPAQYRSQPLAHPLGVRRLTGVEIGMPAREPPSAAAQMVRDAGIVRMVEAPRPLLTLTFDEARADRGADLRPDLPLLLRW